MALTFKSTVTSFSGGCRASTIPLSATRYISASGGVPNATEDVQTAAMANNGVFKWAVVKTSTAQSNTGSLVFTWRKNKSSQSLIVTVASNSAAGTFTDMTNSFSCVAGDVISVMVVNNATATSAAITGAGSIFHGLETDYSHTRSALSCTGGAGTVGGATTTFADFLGSGFGATESALQNVVSADCTASTLYLKTLNSQPSDNSLVLTLRINSADTSTVITISAASGAGGYFSTVNTSGILAGDTIGLKIRNNSSFASAQFGSKSVVMSNGRLRTRNTIYNVTGNGTVASASTQFTGASAGGSFSSVETQRLSHAHSAGVIYNFYLVTTTTQKAAGATTFTFRKNQVDMSIVVVVAANSAPGVFSDVTNTSSVSLGDYITVKGANPSAGVSATVRFGFFLGE